MADGLPPDIDDDSIPGTELLYRRVRADMVFEVSPGKYKLASGALKENRWPLSVDLSSLANPEHTRDWDKSSPFHVASFSAKEAREVECRIVRDPLKEVGDKQANPAHALLFGNAKNGNGALAYKSQSRKIAKGAAIVLLNRLAPPPKQLENEPDDGPEA